MVSGFPHAGRISTTSCGVIVHRQACIHRSGSRFGSAIAFSLYWNRFFSARSSQCSSSHRSYSSGGHVPASSGAHGHRLMTQWYWSKSVQSTRFSSTRRCRSSNPSYWLRKPGYRRSGRVCALPFESTQRAHAHKGAASGSGRGPLVLHFAHHPLIGGADAVPPVRIPVLGNGFRARGAP